MKKIIFVLFFCYSSFFNISSFSEEKKPWLGISVKPSGDKEIKLVISNVEPKSPADVSDLKKNDLLKSLNGKNIKNSIDFIRQFNKLKLGQEINITVKRNNKLIKKKIKLIGKEINLASEKYVEKEYTAGFAGIPSYRDIKNLNYYKSSKLKKILDGNKNEYLIISCIYKGTDASEKLRLYDKITEINNKPIRKSSGLTSLADKEIQVTILRGSKILKEKIQNIKRENLYQHQLNCIKEHIEYECQDFVNIAPDRRKENYWEEIFECLNKKKVNTIPIGTLSWDLRWIKLKSLEKLIKKYSLKKTRDLEKLKYYVPIALEALSEFENYQLSHTKTDVKGEDEYKRLVKTISYSIRYAQVRGIKGIEKYNINLGLKTVANTKKDLENILNKSKLEIYDLEYIDDSFDILLNRKENEYIKKIWPKLINKIDWENIYKYSGKFSPKENTIKSFQIFLDLGDLYIEEQNFKKSVDIYELGLKNLENWKKNNEINLYYIVYKRKFVVSYATPKTFLLVTEYNANLDNKKKADKAFQKLKSISDELKNIEKSFYLLNSDIQLQIRKRYPKHLIYVYQSLQTSNQFLQDKKESYVWAKKLYEETKSLPKNRDNISDMFEAHYTMIIASLGVNRLQVANYHINEFKNYSLRLVENVN